MRYAHTACQCAVAGHWSLILCGVWRAWVLTVWCQVSHLILHQHRLLLTLLRFNNKPGCPMYSRATLCQVKCTTCSTQRHFRGNYILSNNQTFYILQNPWLSGMAHVLFVVVVVAKFFIEKTMFTTCIHKSIRLWWIFCLWGISEKNHHVMELRQPKWLTASLSIRSCLAICLPCIHAAYNHFCIRLSC